MAYRFTEAELDVVKEAFTHFDTDGDGVITSSELGEVMRSLEHVLVNLRETFTDEKVEEMMKQVDANSDGKVTYKEFEKLMVARDPEALHSSGAETSVYPLAEICREMLYISPPSPSTLNTPNCNLRTGGACKGTFSSVFLFTARLKETRPK